MDNELGNCSASEPFALRVIGDDMAPEFVDGQVIVIDPGGRLGDGCFVVARHADGLIFRQLWIDKYRYRLVALRPGSVDIVLQKGVDDIVGVVSQRSGKRRSEHKRYDAGVDDRS